MSNLKISDLPASAGVLSTDLVPVVDTSGTFVTEKATVAQLLASAQLLADKDTNGGYVGRAADGSAALPTTTATLAAPAAGLLKIFGRDLAGRSMLAQEGSSGADSVLQPFMGRNKIGWWSAPGSTTVATGFNQGLGIPTTLGTTTQRNTQTTNLLTSTRRIGYVSAALAGSLCAIRLNVAQFFRGLTAPTRGGFFQVTRFGVSDAVLVAGAQTFMGMQAAVVAPSVGNPSTLANIIGVGQDDTDTNWQIMHNDAAGTATRLDTGIAVTETSLLDLIIYSAPGGNVFVRFDDLSTGGTFSAELSANIPATNTLLTTINGYRSNGVVASAVALDFISHYVESDS